MATAPQHTHAVKVTLSHAKELEAGDYNGYSDPYVIFSLDDGQSARSSCYAQTVDPVWSPPEHFDFKVLDPEQRHLKVEVFDHDLATSDDLLGSVSILLKDFIATGDTSKATPIAVTAPMGFTLDAPESVKSGAASQVFLRSTVSPLDLAEVGLELWENQCWMIGTGWSSNEKYLVSHRHQWSTEDGETSSNDFKEIAPRPPLGYQSSGWTFCVGKGDTEGWLYATTFAGPWYPEKDSTTCVRRRRWENICRKPSSSKSLRTLF